MCPRLKHHTCKHSYYVGECKYVHCAKRDLEVPKDGCEACRYYCRKDDLNGKVSKR